MSRCTRPTPTAALTATAATPASPLIVSFLLARVLCLPGTGWVLGVFTVSQPCLCQGMVVKVEARASSCSRRSLCVGGGNKEQECIRCFLTLEGPGHTLQVSVPPRRTQVSKRKGETGDVTEREGRQCGSAFQPGEERKATPTPWG